MYKELFKLFSLILIEMILLFIGLGWLFIPESSLLLLVLIIFALVFVGSFIIVAIIRLGILTAINVIYTYEENNIKEILNNE